jgi:hypothetical protein
MPYVRTGYDEDGEPLYEWQDEYKPVGGGGADPNDQQQGIMVWDDAKNDWKFVPNGTLDYDKLADDKAFSGYVLGPNGEWGQYKIDPENGQHVFVPGGTGADKLKDNPFTSFLTTTNAAGQTLLSPSAALLGTGLAALISGFGGGNKTAASTFPEYKQAPVYNRRLTGPMTDASGATYHFNRSPFQFDPTEAARQYGPTPAELAAAKTKEAEGLAKLYTPRVTTTAATATDPKYSVQSGIATPSSNYWDALKENLKVSPTGNSVVGDYLKSNLNPTTTTTEPVVKRADGGHIPNYDFYDRSTPGIDYGTQFARGGYLSGPGDGMSDHIPATINGSQPAKLSDGEFVLPADVVASIGNGSNKAGSKKLYAIMDQIRRTKYGRAQQPPKMSDSGISKLFTK